MNLLFIMYYNNKRIYESRVSATPKYYIKGDGIYESRTSSTPKYFIE